VTNQGEDPGRARARRCALQLALLASGLLSGCYSQNTQLRQAVLGTSAGPPVLGTAALELQQTPTAFAGDGFQHALQAMPRGAQRSLDDAYQAAFGVSASSPDVDAQTGRVANPHPAFPLFQRAGSRRELNDASLALGQIEHRYGIFDARYRLCALQQDRDGKSWLLVSVVLRRWESDSCNDATPPEQATDTVLDWVVLERGQFDDDKTYAFLLAASARAIIERRRAPDYWEAVNPWRAGLITEVLQIAAQRVHAVPAPAPRA
jgi:hypothetical protein